MSDDEISKVKITSLEGATKKIKNLYDYGITSFSESKSVIDSIKDRNVYISLGRGIGGNCDDVYEFEGTLEYLSEFVSGIVNGLDDDERKYIISNL